MYKDVFGKSVHMISRQLKRKTDEYVAKYEITGVQGEMIYYIYQNSQKKDIFEALNKTKCKEIISKTEELMLWIKEKLEN